ncbi:MAG: hypothetical protein AB8B83_02180 [Bdellovibrionales bacterium]
MFKKILPFGALAILSGCSYAVDTAVQDIMLRTPGAEGAVCNMFIDGVRYRVHPPQTTSIFRSEKDLIIDCMAPGNRRKKVVIETQYADSAVGNVLNAGAGVAWDYASGALFKYPDVVEISFIGIDKGPALIPAQNKPDIRQPEDYDLEEFRPSSPRLNSDKNKIPTEILRRGEASVSSTNNDANAFSENADMSSGKGDLKSVVERYSSDLNPAAASTPPTPIIPGE